MLRLCLQVTVIALALSFGHQAYAASAREDLVHAYVLVKLANNNYGGHRANALHHLEVAGRDLGLDLHSRGTERERQMQSDAQMADAARILRDVRYRLDVQDRDRASANVNRAILEIDKALSVR